MYIDMRTKEESCHIDGCDQQTDTVCDNCGQVTCEEHLHARPDLVSPDGLDIYWCDECAANGGAIIL